MNALSFHPADAARVDVVASLAAVIWREHYVPIIGNDQVEYMLGKYQSPPAIAEQIREGYRYYLVKDARGGVIGYFAVVPRGEGELFLSKIYLLRDCRRKGYGKQMMGFIETIARSMGLRKIALNVNKNNRNSIAAYGKMGFVIEGSVIRNIGNGFVMDDYAMGKSVA